MHIHELLANDNEHRMKNLLATLKMQIMSWQRVKF